MQRGCKRCTRVVEAGPAGGGAVVTLRAAPWIEAGQGQGQRGGGASPFDCNHHTRNHRNQVSALELSHALYRQGISVCDQHGQHSQSKSVGEGCVQIQIIIPTLALELFPVTARRRLWTRLLSDSASLRPIFLHTGTRGTRVNQMNKMVQKAQHCRRCKKAAVLRVWYRDRTDHATCVVM